MDLGPSQTTIELNDYNAIVGKQESKVAVAC